MEKVKAGDKVKVMKIVTRMGGTYEVGDVLTVMETFSQYPGYVRTNKGALSPDEYEIITDEIKPGDTVTLIDKPWEWDGWAKLPRQRRLIYKGFMGKEHVVVRIINQPIVRDVQDYACADIDGLYIVPLAILRKIEPVKLPFDFEPEPVKEEIKHRNGTVGRYIGGNYRPVAFKDGDLVKRQEDEHDGFWPLWVRESDGLYQRCKDVWVDPVKAETERVPMTNEPHPEIKEGTKFVVVNRPYNQNLKIGDVIILDRNDNSDFPFFYHNGERRCEFWKNLAPLKTKQRYTPEQITEAKCYLAEKTFDDSGWTITKPTEAHPVAVVSGPLGTGKAKCAPDDEFNVYIGLMVAFKRYHGEPLPTWIRG